MKASLQLTPALYQYLIDHSVKEDPILTQCRRDTQQRPDAVKQIPPEQGQFFHFLTKLLKPTTILELGTFTGYSALVFALASKADTTIYTCDINANTMDMAKTYWQQANVTDKIRPMLVPALECLDQLLETHQGQFDLIFIDADKRNLIDYYEKSLQLLNDDGVILIDNVLWHGDVVRADPQQRYTSYIKAFNGYLTKDDRVEQCLLPIGDGISLVTHR